MTIELFQHIRDAIASKAAALQKHEGKNFARISQDISNYKAITVDGRLFYIITTNTFRVILSDVLPKATEQYPSFFGQRDAGKVLQALLNIEKPPLNETLAQFTRFLQTEHFGWIVEIKNEKVTGDILRLDLFRHIKPEPGAKNGETEFEGGLFHAFKHYSYHDIPLSTKPDKNNLSHPTDIYRVAIQGFFVNKDQQREGNTVKSTVVLNDRYNLTFSFYHEKNTDVYFIKTIVKHKRK